MTFKIDVLLPFAWTQDKLFTYSSPEKVEKGTFVLVPLQAKESIGLVLNNQSQSSLTEIKPILEILDYKLSHHTIEWIEIVNKYTLIPMHQILKMMLTSYKNLRPAYLEITTGSLNLPQKLPLEMMKESWVKVRKMIANQEIKEVEFPSSNIAMKEDFFSPDQEDVINQSLELIKEHNIILLQGSTGSGKTNVYFEILHKIWQEKKQILILVPEISLTSQLITRFYERFNVHPYRWYNGCKQAIWKWAASGEAGVLIGARSALWAPFSNLGLIIIDEEHSPTYKQESGPRYNAKDIAILKAKCENIPIILVSATPSLETLHNAQTSYKHLKLTRTIKHKLDINLVQTNTWLSDELRKEIKNTLAKNEQVMLFLNRKGFATHIHCSLCSHRLLCNFCTAGLIYHKNNYTHCSYCAKKTILLNECPSCKQKETWKFYGLGIEKIQQEIQTLFPDKKVVLLSSDKTETIDETMKQMENSEIDILIGTQILAQGCHFPNLTLVGIIQGDIGIHAGDIRNTERMYQLISQVKGRCGRADKPGKVIIQTNDVKHPLLKSIADENIIEWLDHELQLRKMHHLPPFTRMIRIIIGAKSSKFIEEVARKIKKPHIKGVEIMGPAPTQLHKYKDEYRWSFLVQYGKDIFPQPQIKKWLESLKLPKQVKLIVDVDPQSFF